MKRLNKFMDNLFDGFEARWQALPIRKQRTYTVLFFFGYTLLTAAAILTAWNSAGKENQGIAIEHIENPVIQEKETVDTIPDKQER